MIYVCISVNSPCPPGGVVCVCAYVYDCAYACACACVCMCVFYFGEEVARMKGMDMREMGK